jgi:hypothetical protein
VTTLTIVHVAISLVAIAAGFVILYGWLNNRRFEKGTALFLATTVATSLTGFLFPFVKFLPSHAFGILSLIILPMAYYAVYGKQLAGRWRSVYLVTAMLAQYLNVFVLITQGFLKVPFLQALAPTQSEPPFLVAQLLNLVVFVYLTILAIKRYHPATQAERSSGEIRTV